MTLISDDLLLDIIKYLYLIDLAHFRGQGINPYKVWGSKNLRKAPSKIPIFKPRRGIKKMGINLGLSGDPQTGFAQYLDISIQCTYQETYKVYQKEKQATTNYYQHEKFGDSKCSYFSNKLVLQDGKSSLTSTKVGSYEPWSDDY